MNNMIVAIHTSYTLLVPYITLGKPRKIFYFIYGVWSTHKISWRQSKWNGNTAAIWSCIIYIIYQRINNNNSNNNKTEENEESKQNKNTFNSCTLFPCKCLAWHRWRLSYWIRSMKSSAKIWYQHILYIEQMCVCIFIWLPSNQQQSIFLLFHFIAAQSAIQNTLTHLGFSLFVLQLEHMVFLFFWLAP